MVESLVFTSDLFLWPGDSSDCFFLLLFSFLLKYFTNMNLHILEYHLKTIVSHCLSLLCWPFSILTEINGNQGNPTKVVTQLWLQPPLLQLFVACGKAMTTPLGMVSGIHRAMMNLSLHNHNLSRIVLLLWSTSLRRSHGILAVVARD